MTWSICIPAWTLIFPICLTGIGLCFLYLYKKET